MPNEMQALENIAGTVKEAGFNTADLMRRFIIGLTNAAPYLNKSNKAIAKAARADAALANAHAELKGTFSDTQHDLNRTRDALTSNIEKLGKSKQTSHHRDHYQELTEPFNAQYIANRSKQDALDKEEKQLAQKEHLSLNDLFKLYHEKKIPENELLQKISVLQKDQVALQKETQELTKSDQSLLDHYKKFKEETDPLVRQTATAIPTMIPPISRPDNA